MRRPGRKFNSTESAVRSAADALLIAPGSGHAALVKGNEDGTSRELRYSARVPRAARLQEWSAPVAEHRLVLEQAGCCRTSGVQAGEFTFTIRYNAR